VGKVVKGIAGVADEFSNGIKLKPGTGAGLEYGLAVDDAVFLQSLDKTQKVVVKIEKAGDRPRDVVMSVSEAADEVAKSDTNYFRIVGVKPKSPGKVSLKGNDDVGAVAPRNKTIVRPSRSNLVNKFQDADESLFGKSYSFVGKNGEEVDGVVVDIVKDRNGVSNIYLAAADGDYAMRANQIASFAEISPLPIGKGGKGYGRFVRDPSSSLRAPYYIANAESAETSFSQWVKNSGDVSAGQLSEETQRMHKVIGLGPNGDRMYKAAANNSQIRYGTFSDGFLLSKRSKQVLYADKVNKELKAKGISIGDPVNNGLVLVKGVDKKGSPINVENQHRYPIGESYSSYFESAAKTMNDIKKAPNGSFEALELISDYYHTMVNARFFDNINNSLVFVQTNALLKSKGFSTVPQGYLDHLAYRHNYQDFRAIFREYNEGVISKPPADWVSGLE